jgi:hypothetical protein
VAVSAGWAVPVVRGAATVTSVPPTAVPGRRGAPAAV